MEQSSSFGKLLLRNIMLTTIIVFAITMFFVTKYSFETSLKDSQKYAKELSQKYASFVQNNLNQAVTTARTVASHFEEASVHNYAPNEEMTIAYLKSVLKHNNNLVGVWWTYDDRYNVFPIKPKETDPNAYSEKGVFSPYVIKSGTEFKYQASVDFDISNEWIGGPQKAGKPYITVPYIYPVDGVDTLMASVCIPMYKNGEFIGSAGVDIKLDSFAKMVSDIKIYDTGYSFLVDNFGMVIGHPNKELLGKKLLEVTNNNTNYKKMLESAKQGKDLSFENTSYITNEKSTYYAHPFEIQGLEKNWSFVINAPEEEYLANAIFIRNFSIIASILGLFVISIIIYISIRKLNKYLKNISTGLEEFFTFLNTKRSSTKEIEIATNCEFGVMAFTINQNVSKIKDIIEEDSKLIEEVKGVVEIVSHRKFHKRIESTTSTESLNELKDLLNHMLDKLEKQVGKDMNLIIKALESYTDRNFTARLDETSGHIGSEVIKMNKMITKMLQGSQKDGIALQESSHRLTQSVQVLNNNATSQASSLEETAASIEEITGNIEQTSKKAQEMNEISNQTKDSATEGKRLATDTVNSMDEINSTVMDINEAITVIDQIAFQTNILSLNAAVEAATAGEAGKGFAVVASEVRNLASRSAEAAKDIKDLVESATAKANKGKEISSIMIQGFNSLEDKVVDTSKLIEDVTTAAKEQTLGMRQIADAVSLLDKFTQENASIAEQANSIARETQSIAIDVVENVNKNNFDGKTS